jgi:hypothetical protein
MFSEVNLKTVTTCILFPRSLVGILRCETEEELELLAHNFTAASSHFGRVDTVELGEGGEERRVTLTNRAEYVQKLCDWLLVGKLLFPGLRQCWNKVVLVIPAFKYASTGQTIFHNVHALLRTVLHSLVLNRACPSVPRACGHASTNASS